MKLIDLTGRKIGSWNVVERHPENYKRSFAQWRCCCDCGTERIVLANALLLGKSTNCGCMRNVNLAKRNFVHGYTTGRKETLTYQAWKRIHQRCENTRHKDYKYYGGRGISVCNRWMIYENFLADMGSKPAGLTIDRIDNNGNYEPSNCRWTTMAIQNTNKRGKWIGKGLAV